MLTTYSNLRDYRRLTVRPIVSRMIEAPVVSAPRWQGVDVSKKPDMQAQEILNCSSHIDLEGIEDLRFYRAALRPDLPWADNHFEERVCGAPINPGVEWANWRMGKGADAFRNERGLFNHNYMERIWPKYAHYNDLIGATRTVEEWDTKMRAEQPTTGFTRNQGIRKPYGDLNNLIELLAENPLARQAFLPMFFPEDTGSHDRTPCTLGWHFICRDDRFHMVYYLRSCDLINHWHNDIYMAARLLLYVLDELRKRDLETWERVYPGTLTAHITSLHCFRGQAHLLPGMLHD